MPKMTGLTSDNRLQPPPKTPNCILSMTDSKNWRHYIAPITYSGITRDQARELLREAVKSLPRTTLIEEKDHYLYFESLTKSQKFTDDVEFLLPADEPVIHMRSASRVGFNDWGVNRKRLEAVRAAFHSRQQK